MKIKSFEYPKSIKIMKKKYLNVRHWSMSHLSHRPSEPAYYIVDCRIENYSRVAKEGSSQKKKKHRENFKNHKKEQQLEQTQNLLVV